MLRATTVLVVGVLVAGSFWLAAAGAAQRFGPVSSITKVWTEPAAGYSFIDAAILAARRSVDVSMYALSDRTLENDLIDRAHAGVDVRVLLNAAYYGRSDNSTAATLLAAGGVHVAWAPSGMIFHAKYVVIDGRVAYVGTGNFQSYYYSSTRDFWVEDARPLDVSAISATFTADFSHRDVAPRAAGGLVWSPGSTSTLVGLIASATRSLLVENEEMDNSAIEAALEGAAHRGVDVKVVMTYSSDGAAALARLERAGVHVSTLGSSQLYIHAKVICADCTANGGTVFIGSENFSTSSLSYNRELGVDTTTVAAVRAVRDAVNADFALGTVAS